MTSTPTDKADEVVARLRRLSKRTTAHGFCEVFPDALTEAADLIATLKARLAEVEGALPEEIPEAWLDDVALADAFHAELKRQGAFSVERYGQVALGEAPFIRLVYDALRRTIRSALLPSEPREGGDHDL